MTITNALVAIGKEDYVLPAIQRSFVWRPEQVERLFDSLMQGYPIGTFLFWNVEAELASRLRLYRFLREYDQSKDILNSTAIVGRGCAVKAVLDGQQRLTALNIGLHGSLAMKLPRKRWGRRESFPAKRLYLDLLSDISDGADTVKYDFKFMIDAPPFGDGAKLWFPVSSIWSVHDEAARREFLSGKKLINDDLERANEALRLLFGRITQDKLITYYNEKSGDLERILNIFIRLNSGGTTLSYSDLLFSIAVSQWVPDDGRARIYDLVNELNDGEPEFFFSKDFILKAGLMLTTDSPVGFSVESFTIDNVAKMKKNWEAVRRALICTAALLRNFGLSGDTFKMTNAALPIACYLYERGLAPEECNSSVHNSDFDCIKQWLVRSLVSPARVWRDSVDTLLTAIRGAIRNRDITEFPTDDILEVMRQKGKFLEFDRAVVDGLLDIRYGDSRISLLLSLMYPPAKPNDQFDVDHIFPTKAFWNEADLAHMPDESERAELRRRAYMLPNLQLLEKSKNKSKSKKMPNEWLYDTYPDAAERQLLCDENDLGDVPADLKGFDHFWEARRDLMRKRLARVLGVDLGT